MTVTDNYIYCLLLVYKVMYLFFVTRFLCPPIQLEDLVMVL